MDPNSSSSQHNQHGQHGQQTRQMPVYDLSLGGHYGASAAVSLFLTRDREFVNADMMEDLCARFRTVRAVYRDLGKCAPRPDGSLQGRPYGVLATHHQPP